MLTVTGKFQHKWLAGARTGKMVVLNTLRERRRDTISQFMGLASLYNPFEHQPTRTDRHCASEKQPAKADHLSVACFEYEI